MWFDKKLKNFLQNIRVNLVGGDNCDIIVTVLREIGVRDLLFQGWKSFMKPIASIPLVL